MFKTRKNFEKMDKKNVQKWDRRKTFVQIRRALGILRNFFGAKNTRPFMVSRFVKPFLQKCDHACILAHLGPISAPIFEACPKNGVPCFRKKAFWVFRGCPFLKHVPKTGFFIFRKQGWSFLGGALCAFWGILGHFGAFWGNFGASLRKSCLCWYPFFKN